MRKHFSLFHAITSSIGRKKSHFVDNTHSKEEMGKWTERKNTDSCRPLILTSIYTDTTTNPTTNIQSTTFRKVTVADTESYPDIIETNANVFGFKSKCACSNVCVWCECILCNVEARLHIEMYANPTQLVHYKMRKRLYWQNRKNEILGQNTCTLKMRRRVKESESKTCKKLR